MALPLLAEALLRVEHKIDALLTALEVKPKPMHFYGQACPVCSKPIQYVIDMTHNVVKRLCGCSTGKQPSIIPLTPLEDPGGSNGKERKSAGEEGPASPGDGRRRGRSG